MRLLGLLVLLAVGGWFAPQVMEQTEEPCPALERRTVAVLDAEVAKLPEQMASDPRLARVRAFLAETMGATRGAMAEAVVRERFAQLPPGAGCVVGWWKMVLAPDVGELLHTVLGR